MIPMRLGGYAKQQKPLAGEARGQKMLIFGAILAIHVVLVGAWWMTREEEPDVIEVVRYFDVDAFPEVNAAGVIAGLETVDSLGAPDTVAIPAPAR